jgi:hypothetical protein
MAIENRASPPEQSAAQAASAIPPADKQMLIDRMMPSYDAVRTEHRIIPGDIATVYGATRRADFIRLAGVRRRPRAVRRPRYR